MWQGRFATIFYRLVVYVVGERGGGGASSPSGDKAKNVKALTYTLTMH